jgi:hypothetical protein
MRFPKGCGVNTGRTVRLLKQLYGIYHVPRGWHLKPRGALAAEGFQASDYDPALFIKETVDGHVLQIWVCVIWEALELMHLIRLTVLQLMLMPVINQPDGLSLVTW